MAVVNKMAAASLRFRRGCEECSDNLLVETIRYIQKQLDYSLSISMRDGKIKLIIKLLIMAKN